jgi:hypothetical protein
LYESAELVGQEKVQISEFEHLGDGLEVHFYCFEGGQPL